MIKEDDSDGKALKIWFVSVTETKNDNFKFNQLYQSIIKFILRFSGEV